MPTVPMVRLRATYESLTWSDVKDEYPTREGGYTDVHNPWGGFKSEVPGELCGEAFVAWRDANVETVTVDLWTAAEMVNDFPGAVWDHHEGEWSTVDYRTGEEMSVMLHVEDHVETVFALADIAR